MDIARKIDTYDISILPYEDCCTVFVPRHPVINPKIDTCIREEEKFNYEDMINKAIDELNTIVVREDDSKYNDLI